MRRLTSIGIPTTTATGLRELAEHLGLTLTDTVRKLVDDKREALGLDGVEELQVTYEHDNGRCDVAIQLFNDKVATVTPDKCVELGQRLIQISEKSGGYVDLDVEPMVTIQARGTGVVIETTAKDGSRHNKWSFSRKVAHSIGAELVRIGREAELLSSCP